MLNEVSATNCWKCKRTQFESSNAAAIKRAATQVEREAIASAEQERLKAVKAATDIFTQQQASGKSDLATVLRPFEDSKIGMNVRDPIKIVPAILRSVQLDHFEVEYEGLRIRTPLTQILRINTPIADDAIKAGLFGGNYLLVVEVFHTVVYKGGVGMGFNIPI
jgi:hypothetical protein